MIQGGTYEFKIAIADAGDRNLDAGVFVSKIEGVFGADLAIQKAVDKSTPCIGDIVEFTLTAKNVGPADATGVQVTDLLPSGFEYDSHTAPSGTTYTPSTGIWNIGNLALYGERVLKIRAKVKSAGVYTNQATITGTKNDPDATNDKAQVTVVPSVPQITIGTGGATICAGSTTQLTGSGTPATSGAWTSSNPSVATVNNSGLVTGVSDGTATITYKNANGCTANVVVDVKPKPTVNVVDNKDFCNGASSPVVTFGSNVTGTTYSWTNDNTSIGLAASGTGNLPAFTATNTGTSPITATITVTPSANGCTGTPRTFTIKVNPTAT
ncbi:Ig-like domain-containing protein, partial [Sphingobacterium wenxiniae]